ncbi:EVI5-like protein isoform X1 [Clavelina lepadiformis]|uniref:EVI5-like protein isoform X1 n=1 Tax=Clavelina lepadiformis TaxID=159417 RepID=UPI004041EB3A
MTQIAGQFKQRMRDLVGFPATNLSSSPTSNRMDGAFPSSNSLGDISVISKPAVLHEKALNNTDMRSMRSESSPTFGASHQELNAEEIQILAKIEEQNRLLESDRKSLKSVSSEINFATSRRSSNGSASPTSVSVHSASSNSNDSGNNSTSLHNSDNKTWVIWGRIVNDWYEFKKRNGKQLKEMIRCGIPQHFRGLVWQLLCEAHNSPHREKYAEFLKQRSPSEKLIKRDIARTYPEQEFFKEKDGNGQEVLFNVIKAYSLMDREVGYCQGSAFIAGLLLLQMPEEEAFCVFVSLMRDYRLRELFKPSMAELGLCMYQLENLLQEHSSELMAHFQAQAFHTSMFASSWFLTLFATFFDVNLAYRILDVFISEGMEIIFRVGLAILLSSENELLQLDMEGMLKHIQKDLSEYYNKAPDLLFQRAYALVRYNPKKMKKLEKDYMTMKSREQEEQVEMRRLRTENRLLRQRIGSLESENGTLADKLIQDRVNRAVEAEEKIKMGKELSIAKRQAMLNSSQNSPSSQTEASSTNSNCNCEEKKKGNPQYSETFVIHLQQELVQTKLKETESVSRISELQEKVCDLEEKNRELTDQSRVTSLQEELIAVKLREAEANGAMKDLTHKLHNLEENWQKHLNRMTNTRRTTLKSSHTSKAALQELQEELMSARFREAKLNSQLADIKQKLLELETANHICSAQLRRSEDDRSNLREKSRVYCDNERVLQQELNEAKARVAHMESKNQEALMSLKLREAESTMEIAEMKQEIAGLKNKLNEKPDAIKLSSLSAPSHDEESAKIIHQLQMKVLQQQQQIGRLRRQVGSREEEKFEDESSDESDLNELLFDATITSETDLPGANEDQFSMDEERIGSLDAYSSAENDNFPKCGVGKDSQNNSPQTKALVKLSE